MFCLDGYTPWAWKPEEGIRCPRPSFSCQLPCRYWELNLDLLKEQQVPFTTEIFFQSWMQIFQVTKKVVTAPSSTEFYVISFNLTLLLPSPLLIRGSFSDFSNLSSEFYIFNSNPSGSILSAFIFFKKNLSPLPSVRLLLGYIVILITQRVHV